MVDCAATSALSAPRRSAWSSSGSITLRARTSPRSLRGSADERNGHGRKPRHPRIGSTKSSWWARPVVFEGEVNNDRRRARLLLAELTVSAVAPSRQPGHPRVQHMRSRRQGRMTVPGQVLQLVLRPRRRRFPCPGGFPRRTLRYTPFHSRAAVTVDRFASYNDDLASEPSVDGRGITFLLMSADHIGVVRRSVVDGTAASLDDLASVL